MIVSKLEATTFTSIALSVLVANLFCIPFGPFFIVILQEGAESLEKYSFLEFFDDEDGFSDNR